MISIMTAGIGCLLAGVISREVKGRVDDCQIESNPGR
jgi:hypothetical protein